MGELTGRHFCLPQLLWGRLEYAADYSARVTIHLLPATALRPPGYCHLPADRGSTDLKVKVSTTSCFTPRYKILLIFNLPFFPPPPPLASDCTWNLCLEEFLHSFRPTAMWTMAAKLKFHISRLRTSVQPPPSTWTTMTIWFLLPPYHVHRPLKAT